MPANPLVSGHAVVSFEILVEGTSLDPTWQILSISVTKEVNRIPVAKIIFADGDMPAGDFPLSDSALLTPGKKITIKIGYDGENGVAFKGMITRHALRIRGNGHSELHIECKDEAIKMTLGRHSKYYQDLTDSRLFDQLIGAYGLTSDSQATTLTHKEIVQHHVTDWDFLMLRAEANGMLVNVNDGVIKIARPDTSTEAVLQVTYGDSMIEFDSEMDMCNQWENVEASSWDYSAQQLFTANSSSAQINEHGNISGRELASANGLAKYELHHSGHLLQQELQDWTEGTMIRSRLSKIRGRTRCQGFLGVKPGDMVLLEHVGDRFNGKAYITAIKHDLGDGNWLTSIQFGLDPTSHAQIHKNINDDLSAGLVGSIHGLQIGKVVQLEQDPDGDDRILVKIPTIDKESRGIWTRVASLDAGNNRGAFFRPEVDDEVIVGFINGDPRHAVMLGMLHSSAKPAPIVAKDTNHEKGFTTRSNMHLSFNDETKTIKIDTPAGNSITIDEKDKKIEIKDQNQNIITMDPNGIKMESPKNVDIKAGANLSLTAGASLSIGGVSISVKADSDLGMKGAQGTFDGGAMATIKGGMVMIN